MARRDSYQYMKKELDELRAKLVKAQQDPHDTTIQYLLHSARVFLDSAEKLIEIRTNTEEGNG